MLLASDGTLKITDFGMAKRLDEQVGQTQSGVVMGTPSYMAPEQASGRSREVGPAADVYALGAILYELLTGRPPFKAASSTDTVMQVLLEEPVSPLRLQPKTPRDLETVCLKCLEKQPGKRCATAQELADELGRFLKCEPIKARPVSLLARVARWCRRNPSKAVTSGLAALVVLTTVALAVGYAFYVQQTHAKEQIEEARRRAELLSVSLDFDRSFLLCEADSGRGMLWLSRNLRFADQAGAADVERVSRVNLAHWREELIRLQAVLPHQGKVRAVAFSPDSKTILTASWDNQAQLWDRTTLKPGHIFPHEYPIRTASFSPDGKIIVTGGGLPDTGGATLWDATEGKKLRTLTDSRKVYTAAFSPDGRTVLTGSIDPKGKGEAQLWDVATGQSMGRLFSHASEIRAVAFSRDGRFVLTGSEDQTVQLWDVATGRPLLKSPLQHRRPVRAVVFSADARRVLTASYNPETRKGEVRLWDAATGKPAPDPLLHDGEVYALAVSPDGTTLLTGCTNLDDLKGEARLWDLATGSLLRETPRQVGGIVAVAFSPDGGSFLTGADDHTARLCGVCLGVGSPARRSTTVTPSML